MAERTTAWTPGAGEGRSGVTVRPSLKRVSPLTCCPCSRNRVESRVWDAGSLLWIGRASRKGPRY